MTPASRQTLFVELVSLGRPPGGDGAQALSVNDSSAGRITTVDFRANGSRTSAFQEPAPGPLGPEDAQQPLWRDPIAIRRDKFLAGHWPACPRLEERRPVVHDAFVMGRRMFRVAIMQSGRGADDVPHFHSDFRCHRGGWYALAWTLLQGC